MWLLSTHRAELHFFASPESVPGGYAILSHVWVKNEQTFQDLKRLKESCARPWSRRTPRYLASAKIRRCCEFAQKHGYDWVWIDTCCIDKSSSAALQEAINSMFRYYSLAEVCYAYLEDVLTESTNGGTHFSRSVWHGRGWTLQELIAPQFVLFLSQSWEPIGSKADLAKRIEAVTGIPETVLRGEAALDEFSIAPRMSWAAARRTTRSEDEAYSLMGLFDVNMPTIYGEGRKAFQRLQEEIMRRNPDTTVFAWGDICDLDELAGPTQSPYTLFAQSPADFLNCRSLTESRDNPALEEEDQRWDDAAMDGITTLSITPHGVLANIPIVQIQGFHFADFAWCDERAGRLLLCLAPHLNSLEDATPTLDVACYNLIRRNQHTSHQLNACRLLRIHSTAPGPSTAMSLSRRQTYLAYGTKSTRSAPQSVPRFPMDTSSDAPFRLHKYALADVWSKHHATLMHPTDSSQSPASSADQYLATFSLVFSGIFGWVDVRLGLCTLSSGPARVRWASVRRFDAWGVSSLDHDCQADHISGWSDHARAFHIAGGHIFTLRFTRCGIKPERTMVLVRIEAIIRSRSGAHDLED